MFNSLFKIGIVLVLLDSIYLNLISDLFNKQIKNIQGSDIKMNYYGAIIAYIFLILGLYYFIIKQNKSVKDAFLLGLVIYGVYEGTNYALFNNWSECIVIIDTLWGGILFGLTTWIIKNIF